MTAAFLSAARVWRLGVRVLPMTLALWSLFGFAPAPSVGQVFAPRVPLVAPMPVVPVAPAVPLMPSVTINSDHLRIPTAVVPSPPPPPPTAFPAAPVPVYEDRTEYEVTPYSAPDSSSPAAMHSDPSPDADNSYQAGEAVQPVAEEQAMQNHTADDTDEEAPKSIPGILWWIVGGAVLLLIGALQN